MIASKKILLAAVLTLASAMTWAEGKIVVLDPTGAVLATNAAKAKFDKLSKSADYTAAKAKFDGVKSDYTALRESYQKDSMTWSEEKRTENEKKLQSLEQDLQFQSKKLQAAQQDVAQEVMREMGPKLEAVVKQLVEAEKIGLIVDSKSVMMAKPEFDLTAKVTEQLNKAK